MARLKGSGLKHIWLGLERHGERALELLPPRLHPYFADGAQVSVAEWYPEEDAVEMLRVWARLEGLAHAAGYARIGRAAAEADLASVYRSLLRDGDPAASVRKMPVLWSSYQDTGRLVVRFDGETDGRLELSDQGTPTREMCGVFAGYVSRLLELAGATGVEVTKEGCRAEGGRACGWRFKFHAPI